MKKTSATITTKVAISITLICSVLTLAVCGIVYANTDMPTYATSHYTVAQARK